jgi:hypothetical protein
VGRPQWKFGGLVVVEANGAPLVLVVAAFAFCAVASGVDVLNLMAIVTCGADALIAFADMAGRADDGTMCALEREPGSVVVIRLDAAPCRFAVTIVAGLSKTAPMRIIRLVAVEAASGRVPEFGRFRVATDTRHCFVCLAENKICERVVEGFTVEQHDIGLSPLVIGMTMIAVLLRSLRPQPMKSFHRRPVRSDFLVTGKAEPTLRPSREWLVTVAALLLELDMSGDDRPCYDKLLEYSLRSNYRRYSACHNDADYKHPSKSWAQQGASTQKKCAANT